MENERAASDDERRRQEIREIGQAVKLVRNSRGWSLRRLAEEAGLSASLLSAVETGKIVPTVGSLFAISDALGERAEALFPLRRRPTDAEDPVSVADGQGAGTEQVDADPKPGIGSRAGPPEVRHPTAPVLPQRSTDEAESMTLPPPAARSTDPDSPTFRRTVRRPRVVARRSSRLTTAELDRETPTTESPATGESAIRSQGGQPVVVSPGVAVRRADERPTMALEDGSIWSLPVEIPGPIGKVIEVAIPKGTVVPLRHRVRDRDTMVMVTDGRLRIDAAFVETALEAGDSAVVSAGVAHRMVAVGQGRVTYLLFVIGEWDGKP